ncbi:hypothetical protein DINM_021896 [Dirofilaria immitis]|nr:hypothetical protein [Dirofilaria immitis]
MTKATCLLMVIWSMILLAYRTESQYASRRGFYVDHNRAKFRSNQSILRCRQQRIRFDNSRELPKDILMHWPANHWVNGQLRYYSLCLYEHAHENMTDNKNRIVLEIQSVMSYNLSVIRNFGFSNVQTNLEKFQREIIRKPLMKSVVHPRDVMMSLWCHSEYEYDNPESCYLPSHRSFCVQSLSRENFPAQIFNELEAYDQHASI